MVPANRENPNLFEFLDVEAKSETRYEDEAIASNLYYVSLPYSLAIMAGVENEITKSNMSKQNDWLLSVIPEAKTIYTLNFDRIKAYIPDCEKLKSCDSFYYAHDCKKQCFLIEFKATTKDKLLKLLALDTDDQDAIIKKVTHSKTILNGFQFNREEASDKIVARTHIVVVYDGKNNVASSSQIRSALPRKTRRTDGGKQQRASRQNISKKEIDQPTKRFAEHVQRKLGFCSVTKKEFPGAAFPDENPRFTTFMTATDFSKAVDVLFKDWNWGDYASYFTKDSAVDTSGKTLEPV